MSAAVKSEANQELLDRVRRRLAQRSDGGASGTAHGTAGSVHAGSLSAAELADAVRQETGGVISDVDLLVMLKELRQDLAGAGILDPLLRMERVTDVLVTAPDKVWFDRGNGLELSAVQFADDEAVRRLAVRLAASCGRRLDDAQPYTDGFLPVGAIRAGHSVRVHALLAPPAGAHCQISLRVLHQATTTLPDLVANGSVPADIAETLRQIVNKPLSFLVTGGTGTGKTTLLSALLGEVPATERLICIEDTAELEPQHPHVVKLVSRPANVEGAGQITQQDLLRQALRMRPDRIIVGEIRGAEVSDLLAALNTGHDGGAGTIHANSPAEIPARMEALGAMANMDRASVHAQLAAAVNVVLSMERRAGRRRLAAIGVLHGRPVEVAQVWTADGGRTAQWPRLMALLGDDGQSADRGGVRP